MADIFVRTAIAQRMRRLAEGAVDRGFGAAIEGLHREAHGPAAKRRTLMAMQAAINDALRDADIFEAAAALLESDGPAVTED